MAHDFYSNFGNCRSLLMALKWNCKEMLLVLLKLPLAMRKMMRLNVNGMDQIWVRILLGVWSQLFDLETFLFLSINKCARLNHWIRSFLIFLIKELVALTLCLQRAWLLLKTFLGSSSNTILSLKEWVHIICKKKKSSLLLASLCFLQFGYV